MASESTKLPGVERQGALLFVGGDIVVHLGRITAVRSGKGFDKQGLTPVYIHMDGGHVIEGRAQAHELVTAWAEYANTGGAA